MNNLYVFGKKGFIAKDLLKKLKKKKIKFKAFSKKEINLVNKQSCFKIKKLIKDNSNIIFISAIAPAKTIYDLENNLKMIKNFFKGLKEKKINQIIYISSDAVYSDTKKKINENTKCVPNSIHGKMHLSREKYLKKHFKGKVTILRPTLIYGKGDPHNGYGPNKFLRLIKKNKNISLFGKGEELRDHVSINDVTKIILMCLGKYKNKTINIVSGKKISFFKIAKLCINKNKLSKIKYVKRKGPMPHKGLRQFSQKTLKKLFPSYKFQNLENYIKIS